MTGLEKIINQIMDEANDRADTVLKEAQAQADELKATAKKEAQKKCDAISEKSVNDEKNYQDRIRSSADLQKRQAVLEAKQEVIAEVIQKAYEKLSNQGTDAYLEMILKLLEKVVQPEAGEIFFAGADQGKITGEFQLQIQRIAAEKGGSLTVSKESRKIDNGFVLAYGGIEENCSLKALFDAKKDELQDKVHAVLFA